MPIRVTTTGVLLSGAALFTLYQLYKFNAVGNLVFYPGAVTDMQLAGYTPVITFLVEADNTASVPVTINSLAGNLFVNGTLIGNVRSNMPVIVPANGRGYATVTGQLSILGIVNDLIRIWQMKNFTQKISFEGVANVGGLQIPLKLTFNIGM